MRTILTFIIDTIMRGRARLETVAGFGQPFDDRVEIQREPDVSAN